MRTKTGINTRVLITLIVFAFFIFTMAFQLTHSSLWGDEWVEYNYSQEETSSGILYEIILTTFQPPLYNYLMHYWLLIDNSILWFRLFNVFIGVGSGILLYLTVKKLCGWKTACVTLGILAAVYEWVYCTQECAEYALMLFFLFLAFYAWTACHEKFHYGKMALFILACVGAAYSQYGSAFVVLPLLLFFWLRNMTDKTVPVSRKVILTVSYVLSFALFAVPLYIYFAAPQLERNGIATNAVTLTGETLLKLPFVMGNLIGYFLHIQPEGAWAIVFGALSLLLIGLSVFVLCRKTTDRSGKYLILTLWTAYILHFFLTELHIYAMVHAGLSSGFYCRYSYFYIPLLCAVLPVLFTEAGKGRPRVPRDAMVCMGGAGLLCVFLSCYSMLGNWYKAKDDIYAKIWLEHEGWKDTTYVLGMASYGFDYYISRADDGSIENLYDKVDFSGEIELDYLPDRFWAWRTNWGGDAWGKIVDRARSDGWKVTVFDDAGYSGQLAFCSRE